VACVLSSAKHISLCFLCPLELRLLYSIYVKYLHALNFMIKKEVMSWVITRILLLMLDT
jgi:hypothetical protein